MHRTLSSRIFFGLLRSNCVGGKLFATESIVSSSAASGIGGTEVSISAASDGGEDCWQAQASSEENILAQQLEGLVLLVRYPCSAQQPLKYALPSDEELGFEEDCHQSYTR